MKRVVEFLNENPVQTLATVGLEGNAKARPFMFMTEKEGKLWFCTNNQKEVYKEMQNNSSVAISVSNERYEYLRITGDAVFEDNMEVKEICIENPIVKGQYEKATNPIFEVFYIANPKAIIADFSGNPPYEAKL
ncbi:MULTISPECIES: pyridoxamine 5'-phosphate oxidase family protein [Peptacetobacter]|uniref:pyridoxamine 5'-phosphate oxidase family protein n=1 Tax=Peptacetobacter TaxID=2743582 RepID=UPI002E782A06|nr:pyridoxamine 5'-phosphate oxidase family protein [Peptacetobacter hiranonis]MEE0248329.1 pyridoxamine 5'-phosphate oxidase family protein [Peptacetobacter hiranonis]